MTQSAATTGPIKSGRPRAKASEGKPRFYETKLYALLRKALPQHVEDNRLNPKSVAKAIGMHRYTVYKWLSGNFLSPRGAEKLLAEADGGLTKEQLANYIIR